MLNNETVLVTGGTGSFGHTCTEFILRNFKPRKLIIFSRDEFKQFEMAKVFPADRFPAIRFFLGDVRDINRLKTAFHGVDYVVHAAALKQVPALEYNPTEAVKTNVEGANNVIEAAIEAGVKKVIALSTDKAVSPANLYGATKLVAEKLFIAANAYSGGRVKFSVVRYGNVIGSRGSVIPLFLQLKKKGVKEFPITDERMTRFWVTLQQGVDLVMRAVQESVGGEIFVPKAPSMRMVDLARGIEPECTFRRIGIRPGEKIHETLISEEEGRKTFEFDSCYVILPQFPCNPDIAAKYGTLPALTDGFTYRSDQNKEWLDLQQLQTMIRGLASPGAEYAHA